MTATPHSTPTEVAGDPSLREEALALLRQLVRNACVNDLTPDSGQEVRNADTLEAFFEGSPVTIRRLEARPGRTSIIVTLPGSDPAAEPLTFLGHTDVVPVDPARWTRDPFGAEVADGAVWGRGTVDMLGLTASMAAVTRRLATGGTQPRGTLTFVGVADEEARGGLGAKWLSEVHPEALSWKNCVSETGGSHLPVTDGSDAVVVVVGEKGAAQRRLHVSGDAGHGSTPFARDSAVVRIAEVARRVAAIRPPVWRDELWRGFVQAFRFDAATEQALIGGTAESPGDADTAYRAFGDLTRYAHAISHLSIAPTVLHAGGPINVLPSSAHLELDIRPLPGTTDDDVDAVLREGLGDLADSVRIERLISEPATVSPTTTALYRDIEATIGEFFPKAAVVPTLASGGSDLRFARRLGGVGYGFALHQRERTLADVHGQLHTHDEHLHLADLELTVTALHRLAQRFLGEGFPG